MKKEAQGVLSSIPGTAKHRSGRRSLLNKLREKTDISGIAAEKLFNPEFERVMESLRQTDNKIRAIASGTDIDGEDPGEDATSLKDLLKSAKSNLNRREYMTALAFLARFHKKVESISNLIKKFNFDVNKVHNEFLFKDLDDEHKKYLHEVKNRFAASQASLVAEADVKDFLVNLFSNRGRALSAWEKRYPNQTKQLKKDIANIFDRSETMFSKLISELKNMASARATRKIDNYVASANKISSQYDRYNQDFKNYYNGTIKSFLEKEELVSPTKPVENAQKLNNQEIDVDVGSTIPPTSEEPFPLVQKLTPAPVGQPTPSNVYEQAVTPGKIPTPTLPSVSLPEEAPDTIDESGEEPKADVHPELPPPPSKAAHRKFMQSLTALADESPEMLILHISKYAKSIQKTDPESAIQLFNIIKSIKQG